MKKLFFALAVLLAFNYTNAQTCSSPILLDGFGGSFTPVDSFNVQDRFFKFTATNPHHKVKAYIKRLSTLGGNIYVNMYTNNCGSLPSSSLTLSPTTSGDTIIVDYSNFVEGTEYLVEIGKVVNNSSYVVYSLSASSSIASFTWSCGSCPSTNTVCDLVCNGSFECLSSPVNNWSGATNNTYANNWVSATLSSPDIFTSTTFTPYNVPCNAYGSETGKTGSNYAGINMGNGGYSEYLETQLVSPMQGSKKYIISFWVSKAEIPTALTKAIGIYLTNTPISLLTTTDILNSSYTPNAILTYTSMLNTTSGWTKISFCYNATGNEQYLTIGRPQGYTSATGPTPVAGCSPINNTLAGSMDTYSYMYIDDVSVTLFEVTAGATQTVNVCGTATLNSNFTCGSPTVGLTSINYSWGGTNGFSSASTNTTSNVITTTNFNITVTGYDSNNASCAATGTLAVISNTPNPITLTPSANTVCPGAAVTITATGSSATCTFN
ncbi:MAG: hypothetical protein ABIP51_11490, partial [Bacteroidia bacterium]